MRKKLTKFDIRMARKIISALARLDGLIFPEKQAIIGIVQRREPRKDEFRFSYISTSKRGSAKNTCYQIFVVGIEKAIVDEEKKRIILIKEQERKVPYENWPFISEEEVIIEIVAHEVRHRVQDIILRERLAPEMEEKIVNRYLRGIIRYVRLLFEEELPKGDYNKEFDAKVIEFLVGEMWHWGERDLSKIALVIRAGAKELESIIEQMEILKIL